MTPEELLEILHRANMLKINTRHNWTIGERKRICCGSFLENCFNGNVNFKRR